MFEVSDRTAQ